MESGRCSRCSRSAPVRQTAHERGYTGKWQKAAKAFLVEHPLCRDPFRVHGGVAVPAREVDHIIPHKGDQKLFWRRSNWQGLCKPCHSRKTANEGGFGRPISLRGVPGCNERCL